MRMCMAGLPIVLTALVAGPPAIGADWLDARTLSEERVRELCALASDVRHLARQQMLLGADARWRSLSSRSFVIEGFEMGTPPLDRANVTSSCRLAAALLTSLGSAAPSRCGISPIART